MLPVTTRSSAGHKPAVARGDVWPDAMVFDHFPGSTYYRRAQQGGICVTAGSRYAENGV